MQEFPELNKNQVALLRVETVTGIVLDVNFNYSLGDSQKVYTLFESINEAHDFILKSKELRKGVDYVMYDDKQEAIETIFGVV